MTTPLGVSLFTYTANAAPSPSSVAISVSIGGGASSVATAKPNTVAVSVLIYSASGYVAAQNATAVPEVIAVPITIYTPLIVTYGGAITFVSAVVTDDTGPGVFGVRPVAPFADSVPHYAVNGSVDATGGSASILTDTFGFRGLFCLNPVTADPLTGAHGPTTGVVDLMQTTAQTFSINRVIDPYPQYDITLTLLGNTATCSIQVTEDVPLMIGLGFTFDSVTGDLSIWRSDDLWVTWSELPLSTNTIAAGTVPNISGQDIWIVSGDWYGETPWVELFQFQFAETTDITDFDSFEVAAWNYGGNVDSVITATIKKDAEDAVETTLAYTQNYSTTLDSRTIAGSFAVNVPSNATTAAPSGTACEFIYASAPIWHDGPGVDTTSPRFPFHGNASMGVEGTARSFTADEPVHYRMELLQNDGTPVCSLKNAALTEVNWELNGLGGFVFTIGTDDPALSDIIVNSSEVQVWRGTELLHWGVVVRLQGTAVAMEVQCVGLGWYFTKRIVGAAEVNKVTNGGFEDSSFGWWHQSYHPAEPAASRNTAYWTSEVVTERAYTGQKSLKLTSNANMRWGIHAATFFFWTINSNESPEGDVWTVSAWCYIPSADWVGERKINSSGNIETTGLVLFRASTTEVTTGYTDGVGYWAIPKIIEQIFVPITADTPRDTWVRLEAQLRQPITGTTEWIQVMLGCPIGTVFWDEVTMTRDESLYFNNVDQAAIMQGLVEHSQSTTYGKSNLRIGTDCKATGIKRTRIYPFYNHELISDALTEMTEMWQGVDWDIVIDATTRTYTTYYPMKGTRKPATPFEFGKNIASFELSIDGEQTSNRIVVMADTGTNSSREEAYTTDTTALGNGLVLEMAYNATPGSSVGSLQDQADRGLRRYRSPVTIPSITTYEGVGSLIIGTLTTGDVIRVKAMYGAINLDAWYRIISMSLNPATDSLTLTLNPFEEWNDPTQNWGIPV